MVTVRTKIQTEIFSYNLAPTQAQSTGRTITNNADTFSSFDVTPVSSKFNPAGTVPQIAFDLAIESFGAGLATSRFVRHRSIEVPNLLNAPTPNTNPVVSFDDLFINIGASIAISVVPRHTYHGITTYDIFTISNGTAGNEYGLRVVQSKKPQSEAVVNTDVEDGAIIQSQTLERNRDGIITYDSFFLVQGS